MSQTLQCPEPDVLSAEDSEDLGKSEHQEPQAEQKQEEEEEEGEEVSGAEAASDTVGLKEFPKKVGWKVEEFIAFRLPAILALKFCRPIRNLADFIFSCT